MYPREYDVRRFVSDPGERYAPVLTGEVSETGRVYVIKTGEQKDLWRMHSAQAEMCDINNIVARFQNGDLTVLQRTQGNYLDLTNMPHSLREAYELSDSVSQFYERMPDEIKSRFSGFEEFLRSAGSDQWYEKLRVEEREVSNAEQE